MNNKIGFTFGNGIHKLPPATLTWLEQVFHTSLTFLELENKQVSVLFCSSKQIQHLNQTFRNKDKVTDILSWSYANTDMPEINIPDNEELLWGELAICLHVCRTQARMYNLSLQTELTRLFIHGITHLRGFDHLTTEEEEVMFQEEKKLLRLFSLSHIYTTQKA